LAKQKVQGLSKILLRAVPHSSESAFGLLQLACSPNLHFIQDAAHRELHGQELEAGLPLTVLISDPERKKKRTDANSELREVYVTGLSRFVAEKDVRRVFEPVSVRNRFVCQFSLNRYHQVWRNQKGESS
jgi:hypothetical protein